MNSSITDSLSEDLILLAISDKGGISNTGRFDYGLMGAELIRLAAAGRIDIENRRVVVRDEAPVGDTQLDAALDSLVKAKRPPTPRNWVGWRRAGLRSAYLDRLVSSGTLRGEPRRFLGTRYHIADPARLADARARLDAIALSSAQVDVAQMALGGLAYAMGIEQYLYPRPVRKRMQEVAGGKWTDEAGPGAADSDAAKQTSFRAVVQIAISAAIEAANAAQDTG